MHSVCRYCCACINLWSILICMSLYSSARPGCVQDGTTPLSLASKACWSQVVRPTTTKTWSACSSPGGTVPRPHLRRDPGPRAHGLPGDLLHAPRAGVHGGLEQGPGGARTHQPLHHLHADVRQGEPVPAQVLDAPRPRRKLPWTLQPAAIDDPLLHTIMTHLDFFF